MPGHLQQHPYYKTFDEVQRSLKRMENYLDIHHASLDEIEETKVRKLNEHLAKAMTYIPNDYKLTKHQLKTKKRK